MKNINKKNLFAQNSFNTEIGYLCGCQGVLFFDFMLVRKRLIFYQNNNTKPVDSDPFSN